MLVVAERCRELLKTSAGAETVDAEVVDVLSEAERAILDHVFATPTIGKALPERLNRMVGDLSNFDRVFRLQGVLVEEPPQVSDGVVSVLLFR